MSDNQTSDTDPSTTTLQPAAPVSLTDARGAIFNQRPNTKNLTFAGVPVMVKEPPFGAVLSAEAQEDKQIAMAQMIVRYVYLPTGEQLFTEEDVDGILALPFNDDMRHLVEHINSFLGVQPTATDKSVTAA